MKAIRINETGGPEVMRLEEVEVPTPGQGEVLIKVAAAGINYADLAQRQGAYLTPTRTPMTLGFEVAGTVAALGPGVTAPAVGTRVIAFVTGGYAEYATGSVATVVPIPDALDFTHAAAFAVQGLTAYQTLRESGRLQAGESVLINAAAGGVGTLAVQLAKLMGAGTVVGAASNEDKLALIRQLGADAAINYTQTGWVEQVQQATGGRGVDVVLEVAGGTIAEQSLQCLAPFGRMVIIGAASGERPSFSGIQLMYKNLSVVGYWLTAWMSRPDRIAAAVMDLMGYLASGKLHIIVGQTFPLAEAAEAHRAIAETPDDRQSRFAGGMTPHIQHTKEDILMFEPRPEDHFTFGLWTVGNIGRDPFGEPVRAALSPVEIVRLLADIGAYGVNFHDNDLMPIDATPADRDRIVREFKAALAETGMRVPMATTNLFTDPAFRDGAFTANDPAVRAYAVQKTMRAIDLGVEMGAKFYVFWGGREGVETDAAKNPLESLKRFREALNFLSEYVRDQGYELRFALEPKPNEPRGDIYLATTGAMLAFIHTLDHPDMVGVNPEVAHEHMAGLNFLHAVAQAWDAGKLFHIDLNDQAFGRYDQDFRFGAHNPKSAFFLVQFLESVGYQGSRHFDAHAYRTSDAADVKAFAHGCMRTYLILKEKARQFAADAEIQSLLAEIRAGNDDPSLIGPYARERAEVLNAQVFDRVALGQRGQPYERLDQLVIELLLGVR